MYYVMRAAYLRPNVFTSFPLARHYLLFGMIILHCVVCWCCEWL